MKRHRINDILHQAATGDTVRVCGWIRTRRDSKGGFSFLEMNDGSCLANLQVIADQSLESYATEITRLHPGSSIQVDGIVQASPGAEQRVEVQARAVQVFGFADPAEYALGKQRVSLERLRELAHLRPRTNTFGAMARIRNRLAAATHQFFQDRGFLYLHTPVITASDCEGAGKMFQVTTLDLEHPPRQENGTIAYSEDFFGRRTSLTVSGQLEGETYACALGDVYTFGPTFRAEKSNTRRHLAEFWMIEPEMAFADLADDADLAEAYIRYLIASVLDNCTADLEFFDKRIEPGLLRRLTPLANTEFRRITYSEAIAALEQADANFEFPVHWGCDLQSEHEKYLTERQFQAPVIVTDYPREIKPFYMRLNDDDRTVAAMDVLLPGIGEIIGGSQREERLPLIEARMRQQGLDPDAYWWFLDLRRFGTVPHAGFGLGFERMVQFCTGMANIRDAIPFPRVPNNAEF